MMRPLEARAARPDEAEAVLETLCAAFDLNADAARPIFYGDPFYDLSHKRVLTIPGAGIISCLTVVPTVVRVGGVPVPAGGIAGVATRPEFQRQGHAASLLSATVSVLWNELHYPLSLLHPVSAPLYRRFGWETASSVLRWAATPASLPSYDEAHFIRPAASADWSAIEFLYTELTYRDTGACVRDARRWALIQIPMPDREIYVYEDALGLSGYAIWGARRNCGGIGNARTNSRSAARISGLSGPSAGGDGSLAGFVVASEDVWHFGSGGLS